ncbi:MAG: hypothetical protein P4L72_15850 [Parvibaculum sp.]|uniref:hypothetical protein n=1 Tax=Parvibaculum sp. TaxID=2024848 RepID=UPI00284B017F|nr:hypothetical protein [Parvibaculum sp.]MDR3500688.1 hypothetical protein [Parvibaculum sp.]
MGLVEKPGLLQSASAKISDADLIGRKFVVHDPESLPYSRTLPENYQTATIEYWYDVTPPKNVRGHPYVWCSHDGKRTHWKGYVMKTEDGVLFLLGHDCGSDLYGLDFNLVARDFNQMRDRQGYVLQVVETLALFPTFLGELRSAVEHPGIQKIESMRNALGRSMPHLHHQLVTALRRADGQLFLTRRVRDYAAERRRADRHGAEDEELNRARSTMTLTRWKDLRDDLRYARADDKGELYKFEEVPAGYVRGGAFLIVKPSPQEALIDYQKELQSIYHELNDQSCRRSTAYYRLQFPKLRDALRGIEHSLRSLKAAALFGEEQHLQGLARWASQEAECQGQYRVEGNRLIWERSRQDIMIEMPTDIDLPELPSIKNLLSAAGENDGTLGESGDQSLDHSSRSEFRMPIL